MENFKFLPFCSVMDDGRKTSMKKIKKQMAEGSFYPGESHNVIQLSQKLAGEYMEMSKILFIGKCHNLIPLSCEVLD